MHARSYVKSLTRFKHRFGPYVWLLLSIIKLINHCLFTTFALLFIYSKKRTVYKIQLENVSIWQLVSCISRAWEGQEVILLLWHTSNVKKALLQSLHILSTLLFFFFPIRHFKQFIDNAYVCHGIPNWNCMHKSVAWGINAPSLASSSNIISHGMKQSMWIMGSTQTTLKEMLVLALVKIIQNRQFVIIVIYPSDQRRNHTEAHL